MAIHTSPEISSSGNDLKQESVPFSNFPDWLNQIFASKKEDTDKFREGIRKMKASEIQKIADDIINYRKSHTLSIELNGSVTSLWSDYQDALRDKNSTV